MMKMRDKFAKMMFPIENTHDKIDEQNQVDNSWSLTYEIMRKSYSGTHQDFFSSKPWEKNQTSKEQSNQGWRTCPKGPQRPTCNQSTNEVWCVHNLNINEVGVPMLMKLSQYNMGSWHHVARSKDNKVPQYDTS